MDDALNSYGDIARPTSAGHGMDIASQRADELDVLAIQSIEALVAQADGRHAIHALDVGCGRGGQAARMAKAGARVLAIDIEDCAAQVATTMQDEGVDESAWAFQQMDIAAIAAIDAIPQIIVCQRMLHYLRYPDALEALRILRGIAAEGAMLYLSASGMDTELVDGYQGQGVDVRERFAMLRHDRAEKHGITLPVCLYREGELAGLVREAGWSVDQVFRSDFGNVKLVASLEQCKP